MSNFKPGDTVRLKSGGPTMTVESVEDVQGTQYAYCVWFEKNLVKRQTFSFAVLVADNGPVVV